MNIRKLFRLVRLWWRWMTRPRHHFIAEESIDSQDTNADAPQQDAINSVIITLDHLSKISEFKVRRITGRDVWYVSPTDFTDAYLFLLSIDGVTPSTLSLTTHADYITYNQQLRDGTEVSLTDKTQHKDDFALLTMSRGGRSINIYFISSLKPKLL